MSFRRVRRWFYLFVDASRTFAVCWWRIIFFGRGSRQRDLAKSLYCNDYKVSQHGRERAISQFAQKLKRDEELRAKLWTLSGLRLIYHCKLSQACHADAINDEFSRGYPGSFNRDDTEAEPPESEVLNCLARLRMKPAPENDSSAKEEVPKKGGRMERHGHLDVRRRGVFVQRLLRRSGLGKSRRGATQSPTCGRRSRVAS